MDFQKLTIHNPNEHNSDEENARSSEDTPYDKVPSVQQLRKQEQQQRQQQWLSELQRAGNSIPTWTKVQEIIYGVIPTVVLRLKDLEEHSKQLDKEIDEKQTSRSFREYKSFSEAAERTANRRQRLSE